MIIVFKRRCVVCDNQQQKKKTGSVLCVEEEEEEELLSVFRLLWTQEGERGAAGVWRHEQLTCPMNSERSWTSPRTTVTENYFLFHLFTILKLKVTSRENWWVNKRRVKKSHHFLWRLFLESTDDHPTLWHHYWPRPPAVSLWPGSIIIISMVTRRQLERPLQTPAETQTVSFRISF